MYNISTNLTSILKKLYPEIAFKESTYDTLDTIAVELDEAIHAYRLDRERIFIELWWSGNEHLQTIGAFLLPELILYPGRQSSNIMNEILKHLHGRKLTELLASNFAKIIMNDFEKWIDYLASQTVHPNPMVQCFILQTVVYVARIRRNIIPRFFVIIEQLMHTGNKLVQECVSWALIQLSFLNSETIHGIITSGSRSGDINTIRIICQSALGLGPWIIPILSTLANETDKEIRITVRNTLALVNQVEYSL